MTDIATSYKIKQVTESLNELLQEKNRRYGNSALEPLEIFKGKCKVGDTIDHKLSRVKNAEVLSKNDVVDLAAYLVLTCIEFDWLDFEDLLK